MTPRLPTDPDEFMRFHLLLTKDHPDYEPHYIKVKAGDTVDRNEEGQPIDSDRNPVSEDSPKRVNLGKESAGKHTKITAKAAIRRLERGENVGIAAREDDNLVIIDVDDPEVVTPSELKPTLTAMSRSRNGYHYFYFSDNPTDARIMCNTGISKVGEIRVNNYYTLAPGSWDDTFDVTDAIPAPERVNAGKYTIESDAPMAGITFDELPKAFKEHIEGKAASNLEADRIKEERAARKSTRHTTTEGEGSKLFNLELSDIITIPTSNTSDRFVNPLHPGGKKKTASISDKGFLQCWSHSVSHTALSALAVLSGVGDCESAGQGFRNSTVSASTIDLADGSTFWRMWSYAVKNGILPKDDPVSWAAIQWYALNHGVSDESNLTEGYKLPPGAVSRTKAIIKSKEGIEIINIGTKKPKSATSVTPTTPPDECTLYGIEDGCFVKYEQVKDKTGEWITRTRALCNFATDLQKDTLNDDGISRERWWEGEILINGCRIPFKDEARKFVRPLDHGQVLTTAGGSVLMFESKDLQDIKHAMQTLSTPKVRNVRQTFGLLDTYQYETPSVTIDRDGVRPTKNSDIDLAGKGNSKHLDMQVLTDAEFRATGEHIRNDLLNLHTRYLIDSLTGFTFLAPFNTELMHTTGWTGEHIGLFIVGTTGCGKSFDAVMFQWFFGDFGANGAITSWTATPNELQVAGYYFKDAVYLVDDFKLSHFRGNPSRYAGAIGIMQNYSDGTARDRLTSDIKIREGQPIRGAFIATGEDFPHNEASIEGRYHVIQASGGGNREAGHRCLQNRHFYSGFMARYIAWVFQTDDYAVNIVKRIDVHREMFIHGRENAVNIDRLAQSFAYNLTGYELFCHFMSDCDFVDAETAHNMIDAHTAELAANIDAAVDAVASATAGTMYLEVLSELISSGRFKIHDWDDWRTVKNPDYVWNDADSIEWMTEPTPLEDIHNCIGFDADADDPFLYIMPQVAFAEVCRVATTQGMPFTHTQSGTGKELVSTGLMMRGEKGNSYPKYYQGKTRKVWKIAKHAINYERVKEYEQKELEGITK